MSDDDLAAHRILNRAELAPDVYGDLAFVAGCLEYEQAAIEDEMNRRREGQ